ncbi:MAG: hypothetical protein JJU36_11050 [Phycisphaeraceae bacterium]|nr:hypothetical protein [Phycisphaeraceae bacterium]
MTANPQNFNAANLGDIAKHASLVSVLTDLARPDDKKAQLSMGIYFETHAFRPHCPLTEDRIEAWRRFAAPLAGTVAGARYLEMERIAVDEGRYLCSTSLAGLLLDTFDGWRARALLCERDEHCRDELARAFPAATLLEDCDRLASALDGMDAGSEPPGWVVGLVDPFVWSEAVSRSVEIWLKVLNRHWGMKAPVAVLCFGYGMGRGDWPSINAGDLRQVGTHETRIEARGLGSKVYGLSLMANRKARGIVRAGLEQLGWVFG